jgi:cardiolipin synthase
MEGEAPIRLLAEQVFSRSAGAPLVEGNGLDLLIDGRENYDAWLTAIRGARSSILFENYIFDDDALTREFRDALAERARAGVLVAVIRDWLGCLGASRDSLWDSLRAAGGEVRTYNPLRLTRPFGWLSRDHRKLLVVDTDVGFISGVCVSKRWLGDPAKGVAAWRDTGVAVRGPALQAIAVAFADTWASLGEPLPDNLPAICEQPPMAGAVGLRVIATVPSTAGLYRLSQMVAAIARESLWLTDAYFVGTAPYVQGILSAARDGVDVRLLVPGTSDLPVVGFLSRAGYRPLLEAGVRVFEWNGSMLHAKTAVTDGRWARVGSSNLNIASWMGNREIDLLVEDDAFATRMKEQFEADLCNATEVVLHSRPGGRLVAQRPPLPRASGRPAAGSGRAAAGALRLANSVGAAIANQRVLGSSERDIMLVGALVLLAVGVIAFIWPPVLAWPLGVIALWSGFSLALRYITMRRGS